MNICGRESLLYLNICVPSKFGCFCILCCCFDFLLSFCVFVFFYGGRVVVVVFWREGGD